MADNRNLIARVASAIVGLPLLGLLVFWREPLGFGLFSILVAALALYEYTGLTLKARSGGERAAIIVIGTAFVVGVYLRPDLGLLWAMAAVIATGAVVLSRPEDIPGSAARLGMAGFGIFYVGLVAALPLLHRDMADGPRWVALAIGITFSADTGAYIAGRTMGRRKLAPAVSPGKTVEGAIGGLVAALGFAFLARATFLSALSVRDCVMIGIAAGVLGPIGDLMESLLKRAVGAKDSGRVIPGHGGILDRIDALLFVGAYVYLHVRLFQ